MNLAMWLSPQILGPAVLLVSIGFYLFFRFTGSEKSETGGYNTLHELAAFRRLWRALGEALEIRKTVHLSNGIGGVSGLRGASGLISLAMLQRIGIMQARSDQPPLITSGDGTLVALSQDSLHQGYSSAGSEGGYNPAQVQAPGITPFTYAAGTMLAMSDHPMQVTLLIGHVGAEAALIAEAAERSDQLMVAGSDSPPAQAALLACADETLIGEEIYAGGAYLHADRAHRASLQTQDILRWLIILLILTGVILSLLGVL